MKRKTILESIEVLEGQWNVGSELAGDRGGYTQGGISTRAYPQFADMIESGDLPRETIDRIYFVDYYSTIAGFELLEMDFPQLMSVLYHGKVHGTGIRDYTIIVQRFINDKLFGNLEVDGVWGPKTAEAVLHLNSLWKARLWDAIKRSETKLQTQRVKSVNSSSLSKGIRNRVSNEIRLASMLLDNVMDESLVLDETGTVANVTRKGETMKMRYSRQLDAIVINDDLVIYV